MRNQKGITLVALVVTIVVLLILAAVSISVGFGENGIFSSARQAVNNTQTAIDYERNTLGDELVNFVNGTIENSLAK